MKTRNCWQLNGSCKLNKCVQQNHYIDNKILLRSEPDFQVESAWPEQNVVFSETQTGGNKTSGNQRGHGLFCEISEIFFDNVGFSISAFVFVFVFPKFPVFSIHPDFRIAHAKSFQFAIRRSPPSDSDFENFSGNTAHRYRGDFDQSDQRILQKLQQ